MTPQTVQIQELIRQIDEALRKSIPRFPWLQSGEADQQRQVLQQTRSYLAVLQQQARESEDRPLTGSAATGAMAGRSVETAQQVLQAVLQEMNYLRTNMLQPLRLDIDALQQRRSTLAQEVQQLESQRQQSLPAANQQFVSEFLQSSMQQLQENLTGQVASMLASLSAQTPVDQPLLRDGDALSPAQRLQHMQLLQAQSDQLMMRLDSAIRIIFESMHANINSYEDSLEQGLNRMHTLGQQGEAMFSALVNRLAEHLGRETSTYLQSSLQVESPGSLRTSSLSVETEIDQLLGELNGLDSTNQALDLNQLDLSLEPLDFSIDASSVNFYNDDEITLLQHDLDSTDADITLFQESLEPLPAIPTPPTRVETEDLSSAMDLLNQLNGSTVKGARGTGTEPIDVGDLEADDELYQSLFGDRGETEVGNVEVEPPATEFGAPGIKIVAETSTEIPIAEIAEVSDLFFSGMGDPADEPEAEVAIPPEFSDAELSQSVELFLLKVPVSEPTAIAADLETTPPETIVSLSDLPSDFTTASSPIDERFEENIYQPARSEESLLIDAARPPARVDLDALPDDARQLLESDLSSLEFSDSGIDLPQVSPISENSMPQDHSSTPIAHGAFLTEGTGECNAFSFEGLDDELFEQSPEPKIEGRSLELENLLKKKDRALEENNAEDLGDQPNIPSKESVSKESASKAWHLGIDIGTTGISAVLLNRETRQLYPLYWQSDRQKFRLPATVILAATAATPEFVLESFKPYLKLGIPHYSPTLSRWEPTLQGSEHLQFPLSCVHQSLQGLLMTLNPNFPSPSTVPLAGAMGLGKQAFQQAMRQLATVVVGYPAGWSDTYSFNLREAVLGARLVAQPDQIFLVEEAIATLLSAIRPADQAEIQIPPHPGQDVHLHHADWQGETLVFHAGATVTEMAIVNLPSRPQFLHHEDFQFRNLPYAGNSIDQDIICQLILNREIGGWGEVELEAEISLEEIYVDDLIFPSPGEPDLTQRYRLHQRLSDSAAGQALLSTAQYLKIKLQQQSSFTLKLGEVYKTILRQDLASQVILPYVQRLNRELNALLTQTGTPVLAVQQVICSGGTASLGAIARWLRQKLPNATIIQDTYDSPTSPQETCIPSCSRVAYGLAVLPLHLQVIDRCRQQYSDYYLLQELLRVFPNHPVAIAEIMILLEHQGIDTQICHAPILALLDGHLPAGFVLTAPDTLWLTPESRANPDYQSVQLAPLFAKQPDQTYRPNRHQWNHLRSYLDTLLTTTHQKLAEPLALPAFEEA